ncbi:MAG TPA: c-type cytochrome, partial [Anaerolineae bacterium]|nr:c-type cytochrome [Anaerolineae bacterium]
MLRLSRKWLVAGIAGLLLAVLFSGIWGNPAVVTSQQGENMPDADTQSAFAQAGCTGCHTIPGIPNAFGQVGPDLSAIGSAAASRVDGLDAEAYIRQSIQDPSAFIAPECPNGACPENVMPPNMGERLGAENLELVVNYLLTLQGEGVVTAAYELDPIKIIRPAETANTPFAEPPKTYEDAKVLLGKYLFFDPRLSADATVSCATCHNPDLAFTEGSALSQGYTGTGYFRNTPTLMNSAFYDRLYWDGRMDGSDMPTLVRDHITEAHFMANDGRLMTERIKQVPEYVKLFEDAWGSGPSFGGILKSITAYVQSLNTGATPYDLYMAGDKSALSEDAIAGLELFDANCATCHSGNLFTDGEFYATGVPENGNIWAEPLRHITFRRFTRQLGVPNYRNLVADPGLFALTKADEDMGVFRT